MKIEFEHNYREKIIFQKFAEPSVIKSKSDVLKWRSQWTKELSTWHSPYKCLVDCTQLKIEDEDTQEAFETMLKFFKGFFLKKIAGFGYQKDLGHDLLPFEVFETFEDGSKAIGVRGSKMPANDDFRSNIQFENHFQQHVVELTFSNPVHIADKKMLTTLRSKMTNNLMHWHSKWSLLVDCTNMTINKELEEEFDKMLKFFRGFFLKEIVGYSPAEKEAIYPFKVYRSRHRAAGILTTDEMISGNDANCQSRNG